MTTFSKFNNGRNRRYKQTNKSTYKHVPHSEKPPHLVARRNARERKRVQAVNNAFVRLRRCVPCEPKHKRLSKVKTLKLAIEYIKRLTETIEDHDRQFSSSTCYRYGHQVGMPLERGGRLVSREAVTITNNDNANIYPFWNPAYRRQNVPNECINMTDINYYQQLVNNDGK